MKSVMISAISIVVLFSSGLNPCRAHEIRLKDGRVIQTKTCWEEDGAVKYENYGVIVALKRDLVEEVIYEEHRVWKNGATLYLKNGSTIFYPSVILEGSQYRCTSGKDTFLYAKDEVVTALAGRNHDFADLPPEIQKQWPAATVYLDNNVMLLAHKVWLEDGKLHCLTDSEDYVFDMAQVKRVVKGHPHKKSPWD